MTHFMYYMVKKMFKLL